MSGKQETHRVILASGSRFFLGGIRKILEDTNDIKTLAEASSYEEIEKYLTEIEADFLFLDNRILKVDIEKISKLALEKTPSTKIILLDDKAEEFSLTYPNLICIPREANAQELLEIIKGNSPPQIEQTKSTDSDRRKDEFTKMELKVIALIVSGYKNKDIANAFSISEKTVKSHLTNIFKKMGIHTRYQLQLIMYRAHSKKAKVR